MKKYRITSATESQRGVSLTISVTREGKGEGTEDGYAPSEEESQSKKYLISKKKFNQLGIKTYDVDAETVSRIAQAHVLSDAVNKGIDLLSYADNNPEQIKRKLMERGYPRETAEEAAAELEEMGLIREDGQAKRAAEVMARKMKGPSRIKSELYQKGYSGEAVAGALVHIGEEFDFDEICARLIRKKYGGVPAESDARRRMVQFLVRSGFSGANIREAENRLRKENEGF
jgi:regulatory protein